MKKILLLILVMGMLIDMAAQKIGIEQYFSHKLSASRIEPSSLFFIQQRRSLIAEIRYNYEAENTLSLNAGSSFQFQNNRFSSITKPMIGLTMGSITGINLNLDQEIEINSLYFSTKLEYFFSLRDYSQNFFYAWVESGICFLEKLYGGISLQINISGNWPCDLSKGFVLGFSSGRFDFPVYIFDPFSAQTNITAGIL